MKDAIVNFTLSEKHGNERVKRNKTFRFSEPVSILDLKKNEKDVIVRIFTKLLNDTYSDASDAFSFLQPTKEEDDSNDIIYLAETGQDTFTDKTLLVKFIDDSLEIYYASSDGQTLESIINGYGEFYNRDTFKEFLDKQDELLNTLVKDSYVLSNHLDELHLLSLLILISNLNYVIVCMTDLTYDEQNALVALLAKARNYKVVLYEFAEQENNSILKQYVSNSSSNIRDYDEYSKLIFLATELSNSFSYETHYSF